MPNDGLVSVGDLSFNEKNVYLADDNFFDFVVCNPPFHFEHENNIEVAIDLFVQVRRCLRRDGSFQAVANRHLNYQTHLKRLFGNVRIIGRNRKFEIISCESPLA